MSHVFHRHCHQEYPKISKGQGVYLFDSNGNQYLDGCGGAAVSNLGHSHSAVKKAMLSQIADIPFAHSGFFISDACEQLAWLLNSLAPDPLNHSYFVSGGSEAVESAIKMARQYFVEIGQRQRSKIITREQSYHGNTLGALGAGGNQWRRKQFEPLLTNVHFVSPCYAYRGIKSGESELEYSQRLAEELESTIIREGADQVMAFIAEPIVGATAGAVPATQCYFKYVREICNKYGVLLILDEVMCGVGRSGTFFAFEQEGIVPDIVTMAKGLAAGYQLIGAVMASSEIYDAISKGSGFFQHGHTFMAHPVACAAALATVRTIIEDNLLDRVKTKGRKLQQLLEKRLSHLPYVGDIRGKGLFWGIELVAAKVTKMPLPMDTRAHVKIKANALSLGLMCYPMSGTIDGQYGHHILIEPPFMISDSELEELVNKLEITLQMTLKQIEVVDAEK